jgi:putative ABC transport system ATP-binding protein
MIKIKNLYKNFYSDSTKNVILKNINLEIKEGQVVVLKGVSGSGKTTLLSLIGGLDRPSQGSLMIGSEPIHKLPDIFASKLRTTTIGMVFQHFNLLEHLTVAENVMVPLIPHGLKMHTIKKQVNRVLELANIQHKKNFMASHLSGGEKQRTAIARALVNNPKILLCDEPTANLDKENTLIFIQILEKLHKEGKTIIIATHDPLFDALPFENRVVPMIDGEIVDE